MYTEVQNFFTKQECLDLIERYKDSLSSKLKRAKYMKKMNQSKLVDDELTVNMIKDRINTLNLDVNVKDVHNQVRIVHYFPGQSLGIHRDMVFSKKFNQVSHTLFIYLNEGFNGGRTRIYDVKSTEQISIYTKNKPFVDVTPETGKALIYPVETVHEGLELLDGEKWLIVAKLYCK